MSAVRGAINTERHGGFTVLAEEKRCCEMIFGQSEAAGDRSYQKYLSMSQLHLLFFALKTSHRRLKDICSGLMEFVSSK